MKWKNILANRFFPTGYNCYNEIRNLCREAYVKGCLKERTLAIEAHRLQCINLFGNRCMNLISPEATNKKICDGNCGYMNKYIAELSKLEI